MKLLLLSSHAVFEYDELRLFADLGIDVFAPGGYEDPAEPGEGMRPPLPDAPRHPELAALCREQREKHAGEPTDRAIDWAKADLHPELIEWADVIVVNMFVEQWIGDQWPRIRHKRVVWRTCGQSNPWVEMAMRGLRADGLEIVRYSPAERRHFEARGAWAGEDALIRFAKYPADWYGWTGKDAVVGNITQDMVGRGNATGLDYWLAATEGLPTRPAGPGSEGLPGGIGALSYDAMREYLRSIRAYLYTGTQPAPYTLGLIEAMMTGVPVISIGPDAFPEGLFESHEIVGLSTSEPSGTRTLLYELIADHGQAASVGATMRERAVTMFGAETIGAQWLDFLGTMPASQVERRLAGAAA